MKHWRGSGQVEALYYREKSKRDAEEIKALPANDMALQSAGQ